MNPHRRKESKTVSARTLGYFHSPSIDTRMARLYFRNGAVQPFKSQTLAYALWLALPKGMHVAFRGANDDRPVYPWDLADRPRTAPVPSSRFLEMS